MLHARSFYSLRYGTLSIGNIIKVAKYRGETSVLLTDINNSTGFPDFVLQCRQNNIKPIAGIEFRRKNRWIYTGIAKNNDGLANLNKLLSEVNVDKKSLPDSAPELDNVIFIYPFGGYSSVKLKSNEYIGIGLTDVNKLYSSVFRHSQNKVIIYNPVTYTDDAGLNLHRHLRAIDNNILLSKLTNADFASENEALFSFDELKQRLGTYEKLIVNTERLFEGFDINFEHGKNKNKATYTGNRSDDKMLLEKLAREGFSYRYGKNRKAIERLEHELRVIDNLGFSAYFLIGWDIIKYSMSQGFYHVGRGSGANSIVAYCLKITDVDPIELDLYFERFINPKRTSPPDFDIDYSWKERDAVQDYIFKRFGKSHTALLGSMSTFRGKSIIRELAKVYGLPKDEVDEFIENPYKTKGKDTYFQNILNVGKLMSDFPNLRSIHAGGILISERPIYYYTALDLPPKGFQTTQWDMYVAESLGFEKFDILSQRGIGHIKECIEIIAKNKGDKIDIHRIDDFKRNEKIKQQLKIAETNGCFYIESPAMRGLLRKLRCDDYLTLVAASSIIRPGVAKSGMMREYIKRFQNPARTKYLHPIMQEQLEETFGVMVYQEDVIKICHHFAGLDLADADILRRAMSGKFRGKEEFRRIEQKYFENCKLKGYPDNLSKEVWRQIASFAGYSFSKAHSASYAVESYQSLYLKVHYPLEFMVAVINNFGGFYQSWVYFNEAKRWGAKINLPCVNQSDFKTKIIGDEVFIGFIHLTNFEKKIAFRIIDERRENGDFQSLADFIGRVPIGLENLIILIRINAFRFAQKEKQNLLWEAHTILSKSKNKPLEMKSLFPIASKNYKLPDFEPNSIEQAYDEIEILGFPVTISFFDLLETKFRGEVMANQMNEYVGKTVRMLGQLVTRKYVWTVKKEIMHFGTFLDVTGEFFDTVHFPDSLKKYPFTGSGVYLILGKVVVEFGFASLEVIKFAKLPIKSDPRSG